MFFSINTYFLLPEPTEKNAFFNILKICFIQKKNTFIILCLLFTTTVFCQPFFYFNKQILLDESNQFSIASIPFEEGYYTIGSFGQGGEDIYFAELDKEGNILDYHTLDTTLGFGGGNDFIEIPDGHLGMVHRKFVSDTNSNIAFIKFTKQGSIIWSKQFGGETPNGSGGIINSSDGGFLIIGSVKVGKTNEMYAVKTDSMGVMEWENSYCLNHTCSALSADNTIDGGYILSGSGKNNSDDEDRDMYVVKIDSLGNQEWEKNYGSISSDPGCQIYAFEDGNFLLKGGTKKNAVEDRSYFAKLDLNGEIIWEKIYTIPDSRTIQTPLVFRKDGGFIGVANFRNNNIPTPLVMNFDVNGDTLWTKVITIDPEFHVYMRDIDKIEGGYVLTGFKFFPAPQYGWLVTIDEEGNFCEELGCVETVVDIEDVEAVDETSLTIFPNPAKNQLTLQWIEIPKEETLQLTIYNSTGQTIKSLNLTNEVKRMSINISSLEGGIYYVQVKGNEGIYSFEKIVVIK